MSDAHLSIRVLADLGHINLRGNPDDAAFKSAAGKAIGQALPRSTNTFADGERRVYWLGPNEWLLVTAADDASELSSALGEALAGQHASINDLSGGQIALRLSGIRTRDLLAKGCTLDLHPSMFKQGDCAQSALAKANVLIACVDGQQQFDVIVRRSFADYLFAWLRHAGAEFGIEFT